MEGIYSTFGLLSIPTPHDERHGSCQTRPPAIYQGLFASSAESPLRETRGFLPGILLSRMRLQIRESSTALTRRYAVLPRNQMPGSNDKRAVTLLSRNLETARYFTAASRGTHHDAAFRPFMISTELRFSSGGI